MFIYGLIISNHQWVDIKMLTPNHYRAPYLWILVVVIILLLILPVFSLHMILQEPSSSSNSSMKNTIGYSEAIPIIEDDDANMAYSTRGPRRDEIEPNNKADNATPVSKSMDTSISGSISSENDRDWFMMRLDVYESQSGKSLEKYDNMSVTLSSLSGDNGYNIGIFIYGGFDINQNGPPFDYDSELILLNCGVFEIGDPRIDTIRVSAYNSEYYFFKIETDGGLADYNFRIQYLESENWVDSNQGIDYSIGTSAPMTHSVHMSNDVFDWFKEDKKISTSAIGVNFSIKFAITPSGYYSKQPVTLPNGTTINFVTVLHMLVYHEGNIIANQPEFPFQYRDHVVTSRQTHANLPKEMHYSDVITQPTHPFRWTFYGFYAESYGVDQTRPGIKFYPLVPEMVDYVRNTFCEFSIEEKGVTLIERPELVKVSVKSKTTNSIFGRTYDDYEYFVTYKQPNNNKPLITKLSVFTLNGEIKTNMIKVTPGTVADGIYETGCKYRYRISGLELGEGDHHVFQFHFKDKNAWAIGTIELGKSWHGPYISNNIPPQVRPSAPKNITIYEDSNTTFYSLHNIFEDVDLKDKLNFTISDREDIAWGVEFSNNILDIRIENQSRLKIDPKPNKNGEVKILLNVTDKNNFYTTFKFKVVVLPVNDPPQIIQYFSKISIKEDSVYSDINLREYFVDIIDNEELGYRVENNINIFVDIDKNGNVKIIPKHNWFGTEYLYFYGSDGFKEVSDFLKVKVRMINDVPLLMVNDTIEVWEDQWKNFTINATDFADNETVEIGHNLTNIFPQIINNPTRFGYSFDNYTGYLTFKPTNVMTGTYSWNISAIDENNAFNYTHITLIIHNVNDPPVPKITYPESESRYLTTDKISFRSSAYDADTILKESNFVWYSILNQQIRKIGSGRSLSPQLYENGTHKILLSVDDGMYIRNVSITIRVYPINQDLDSDGDGVPDYWENLYYFSINDPHDAEDDYDKDTFSNWEEYKAGTNPLDPYSAPDKHISREEKKKAEDLSMAIGTFVVLVVILLIVVFYIFYQSKLKKKKKADEEKAKSTEGIVGMSKSDVGAGGKSGKIKSTKIVCHTCGKSLDILTLNRPVVVTCTDCGSRGVVYK